MEGVDEQRVRAERVRDAGAQVLGDVGGPRQIVLDVVAAGEEQRHEDGPARGQAGEGVAQQRLVEFDVAEADGEAGAPLAYPLDELGDGGQGPWVAAAVRHEHEGGRLPVPAQRGHVAESAAELVADHGEESRRADCVIEVGRAVVHGAVRLVRHEQIVPVPGCRAVAAR